MEQLEEIIIKSIETLRSSKKQPNEEAIHNVIKKDLPEVSMDKLKERLNHLLQKEKILNKPHKGKNPYYNIKEHHTHLLTHQKHHTLLLIHQKHHTHLLIHQKYHTHLLIHQKRR